MLCLGGTDGPESDKHIFLKLPEQWMHKKHVRDTSCDGYHDGSFRLALAH